MPGVALPNVRTPVLRPVPLCTGDDIRDCSPSSAMVPDSPPDLLPFTYTNLHSDRQSAVPSSTPAIIGNRPPVVNRKIVRERCLKRVQHVSLPARPTSLRCALWNVRSLSKDTPAAVYDHIVATGRDVFVAVETWHDDALSSALGLACPPGYYVVERARPRLAQPDDDDDDDDIITANYGGIAVFYRSTVMVSRIVLPDVSTFECLAVSITSASHKVLLVAVYRPGSATITSSFYDELEIILGSILSINLNFVILGDFNIHVDDASDAHGVQLRRLFDAYGLRQHVCTSTHDRGHTLDLVVTSDTTPVSNLDVRDMQQLSDHRCIQFELSFSVIRRDVHTAITRNWSDFDIANFVNELAVSDLATTASNDVNYLFNLYNSTMSSLIDKHAPQRTTTRRLQHRAPWYDAECYSMRRQVRRLESVFRRRRLPLCHSKWRSAVVRYHRLLGSKQRSFWSRRVLESDGDSRALWKTLSTLMSPPPSQTISITPAEFVTHFKSKVDAIRASTAGAPSPVVERTCSSSLSSYSPVNTRDIEQLLRRCPNKQCALDPVPTWLVKAAGPTMTAILTKLVNSSLDSATFPSSMKHAIVTPIVKKPGMDPSLLSSYRPISN